MARITLYTVEKENLLVKEKSTNYLHSITTPQEITYMLNTTVKLWRKAEEYTYMLALNQRGKPLGLFEISHGTVNASYLQPREIYLRALLVGATAIVLAHNHPSGSLNPSMDDMKTTKRIQEAGQMLGVEFLDHIIVGNESCEYYSFMERGIL